MRLSDISSCKVTVTQFSIIIIILHWHYGKTQNNCCAMPAQLLTLRPRNAFQRQLYIYTYGRRVYSGSTTDEFLVIPVSREDERSFSTTLRGIDEKKKKKPNRLTDRDCKTLTSQPRYYTRRSRKRKREVESGRDSNTRDDNNTYT